MSGEQWGEQRLRVGTKDPAPAMRLDGNFFVACRLDRNVSRTVPSNSGGATVNQVLRRNPRQRKMGPWLAPGIGIRQEFVHHFRPPGIQKNGAQSIGKLMLCLRARQMRNIAA